MKQRLFNITLVFMLCFCSIFFQGCGSSDSSAPSSTSGTWGSLESPTNEAKLSKIAPIKGWCFSNKNVKSVEILIDNKKDGNAQYGNQRADITAKYSEQIKEGIELGALAATSEQVSGSKIGFEYSLDTKKYVNGKHVLSVKLFTNDSELVLNKINIIIENVNIETTPNQTPTSIPTSIPTSTTIPIQTPTSIPIQTPTSIPIQTPTPTPIPTPTQVPIPKVDTQPPTVPQGLSVVSKTDTTIPVNAVTYDKNNPIQYFDPTGHITQEEQKMYEDEKMAPAAYSYLMNLTYQWYLADDQKSKDYYHDLEDKFRDNKYQTTNGKFKSVDENIKVLSHKPKDGGPWKEVHFFRNELNLQFSWDDLQKLQERLPDNLKWVQCSPAESALHQNNKTNGKDNLKFVSADGHFEAVYSSTHVLQTQYNNPKDMGTYNYYTKNNWWGHFNHDILPYEVWGNVPD